MKATTRIGRRSFRGEPNAHPKLERHSERRPPPLGLRAALGRPPRRIPNASLPELAGHARGLQPQPSNFKVPTRRAENIDRAGVGGGRKSGGT